MAAASSGAGSAETRVLDAVVIGAGIAGLLVAHRLEAAGRRCVLLEAQDRPGGRTRAVAVGGTALGLGASWVWDSEPHVHALLDELGIATFPHHRAGDDLYEQAPGTVLRGRLPRSAVPERRVVGSPAAIAQALARGLRGLHCAAPVDRITAPPRAPGTAVPGPLAVGSGDRCWRAHHVVAALPPALLATRIACAGPGAPGPETVARWARTGVWMAEVAKILFVYERRWWRSLGLSGRAASTVGPISELHDLSGPGGQPPALFGFVHRSQAQGDWRARAQAQLARLFGPAAPAPVAVHAAAWWTAPTTAPPPGAGQELAAMGHPALRAAHWDGRLHLCSTETAAGSPGHLDGAVERAEAVAAVILARPAAPVG